MSEHPINGLMQTAMENIKDMVDVNTIVGEPVQTPDGSVIIPISKVGFGFAAGGSEFTAEEQNGQSSSASSSTQAHNASVQLPFGGGSGGGVSITPIAFLVVGTEGVKVVPLDNQTHIFERLIESAPQWVDKVRGMLQGGAQQAGMMAGGMQQSGGAQQSGMMAGGTQQSGMGNVQQRGNSNSQQAGATNMQQAGGVNNKTGTAGNNGVNPIAVAPKPTDVQ